MVQDTSYTDPYYTMHFTPSPKVASNNNLLQQRRPLQLARPLVSLLRVWALVWSARSRRWIALGLNRWLERLVSQIAMRAIRISKPLRPVVFALIRRFIARLLLMGWRVGLSLLTFLVPLMREFLNPLFPYSSHLASKIVSSGFRWRFSFLLRQFGNMLVLSAAYNSPLRPLVDGDKLLSLLDRTIKFLAQNRYISPSLRRDADILSSIKRKMFFDKQSPRSDTPIWHLLTFFETLNSKFPRPGSRDADMRWRCFVHMFSRRWCFRRFKNCYCCFALFFVFHLVPFARPIFTSEALLSSNFYVFIMMMMVLGGDCFFILFLSSNCHFECGDLFLVRSLLPLLIWAFRLFNYFPVPSVIVTHLSLHSSQTFSYIPVLFVVSFLFYIGTGLITLLSLSFYLLSHILLSTSSLLS